MDKFDSLLDYIKLAKEKLATMGIDPKIVELPAAAAWRLAIELAAESTSEFFNRLHLAAQRNDLAFLNSLEAHGLQVIVADDVVVNKYEHHDAVYH